MSKRTISGERTEKWTVLLTRYRISVWNLHLCVGTVTAWTHTRGSSVSCGHPAFPGDLLENVTLLRGGPALGHQSPTQEHGARFQNRFWPGLVCLPCSISEEAGGGDRHKWRKSRISLPSALNTELHVSLEFLTKGTDTQAPKHPLHSADFTAPSAGSTGSGSRPARAHPWVSPANLSLAGKLCSKRSKKFSACYFENYNS